MLGVAVMRLTGKADTSGMLIPCQARKREGVTTTSLEGTQTVKLRPGKRRAPHIVGEDIVYSPRKRGTRVTAGNGKSTLCGTLLLSAIEQGHSVCAASMELPATKFREWIDLQAAGSEFITTKWDPVKGCEVPVVYPPAAKRIADWYHGKFFLFENVDAPTTTIADAILDVFTMAAKRKGCDVFCVDNLMTALMDSGDDEYRAQGVFMANLKRFAIKYNSHVIVVAHPRKVKKGETFTQDDVGGTKYISNLASNVIVVEKPDLRIIKARDSGQLRLITCCYCGDSRRIYQADVGDKYVFSWDRTGLTPPQKKASELPGYGIYMSTQNQMF